MRDLTRTRKTLTEERSRHKQRVEKILEDAQIKLSTVASDIFGVSGRSMLDAMIAGQRDPQVLAAMARGRMVIERDALVRALTGCFEEHHAFMCRTMLATIDHLTTQIDTLTDRITEVLAHTQDPAGPESGSGPGSGGTSRGLLPLAERLDEIPGIGRSTAQVILAEVGPDIRVFPTPGHLVSWAKLSPRTIQIRGQVHSRPHREGQSLAARRPGRSRRRGLAHRHLPRRLVKRRGHLKALVAVARSILVIVWQLINNPYARFTNLGSDHCQRHIDPERKTRDLIRQLQALGHDVILAPTG